jgi:hypothetical protein
MLSTNPNIVKYNCISMKKIFLLIFWSLFAFKVNAQLPNTWTQKTNVSGGARYGAVSFSIGSKGYIGTGYTATGYKNDFWEYDPNTNIWSQKANFGGTARIHPVGFSIGSKGYIGLGNDVDRDRNDFWEYNPATNSWVQKANVSGSSGSWSVGFSIGTKGYIGTGYDVINGKKSVFWEYDPITDTWTQKANVGGGGRESAVGFSIGSKGYIGTGYGAGGIALNDFWEYDPNTDTWTQKANVGGGGRGSAVGLSIGAKGYIGTGFAAPGSSKNDFWEYDPNTNVWTQKVNVGGTTRGDAVSFSVGSKGYIGTGSDNNGDPKNDFWVYTPSYSAPTITSFTPSSGPEGTSIIISGTNFTGATSVYFNTTSTSFFTINSTTQITAILPSGATTGAIVVTTPGGTATSSTNFTVTVPTAITTEPITPFPNACEGTPVTVSFTTSGNFNAGNVFTAQLINSSGSATPFTMGTLNSTTSGSIWATVPNGTLAKGYDKIRVIASDPATTGSNTSFMVQPSVDYYEDTDRDGYYSTMPTNRCYQPLGINYQLSPGNDCNDFDNAVHPGATEICDGKDNNCDGIQDDIIAVDAIYVTPTGSNPPTSNINQVICQGGSLSMYATVQDAQASAGLYNVSYQWFKDGSPIIGETGMYFNAITAGAYYVQVRKYCISYPSAGITSNSNIIIVTVNTAQTVTATSDGGVCEGKTANLFAGYIAGATYSWTGPNNFTSALQNPSITNVNAAKAGSYIVTVTVNGCSSSATTSILLYSPIYNNWINNDQTICNGQTATVLAGTTPTGGDGFGYSYFWQSSTTSATTGFTTISFPSAMTSTYAPGVVSQTTWFRRAVISGGGCENFSAAVRIEVVAPISSNSIGSDQTINNGQAGALLTGTFPLGGNSIYSYQWERSTTSATSGFAAISGSNSIDFNPGTLTQSTWYRRVVTSGNCTSVSNVVAIQVLAANIVTGTIPTNYHYCPGAVFSVPFTVNGTLNSDNIFTAQLSSSSGSFANPVNLGTLSGIASGSISVTIPVGTGGGLNYRIRVVASGPAINGTDNGQDINIFLPVDYYLDSDADGYFSATPTNLCYAPLSNYQTTAGNDCNDFDNTVHPGASEICDGKDNNCDGISDPVVTIPTAPQTIYSGQSVQLSATGATTYSWASSPAGFTSASATPTVNPAETTTYTVTGSGNGCSTTASVTITVTAPSTAISLSADSVKGLPGTQVTVPIRVRDFVSMITAQGTITYNPGVATLAGVEQFGLSGLGAANFNTSTTGEVIYSWDDATLAGITLANDAILFVLRFNIIGTTGGSTPISFVNAPTFTEFTNSTFTAVSVTKNNGSISIPNNNILTIGTLSSSAFCAGSPISIPFIAIGTFNAGNIFTAQLSNANGSFVSPVAIGTMLGTISGSIGASIPLNTTGGSGYRIRVMSSGPATIGSDNGSDLMIQPTVDYYLDSDADGYFSATPTNLCYAPLTSFQTTAGNDCNDFDNAVHPNAIEICDGKDNNCDGFQDNLVTVSAQSSFSVITLGNTVTLSVQNPDTANTYTWSGNGLSATSGSPVTATPTAAGTYNYIVTASNGICTASDTVSVTVQNLIKDAGIISLLKPETAGCYGSGQVVQVRLKNYGNTTLTSVPVQVKVSGVSAVTLSATYAGSLAPGDSADLVVGTFGMTRTGSYTFRSETKLTGDAVAANNVLTSTRSVTRVFDLPLDPVTFDGFTSTQSLSAISLGWNEGIGAKAPVTGNSDWKPAAAGQIANFGSETGVFRFDGSGRDHWLISPKFVPTDNTRLYFDAAVTQAGTIVKAVMGTGDSLKIMVSTNCGKTYAPLYTIEGKDTLTHALTSFTVKLDQYQGQEIMLAFQAKEGSSRPASLDLHLDNIQVGDPGIYSGVLDQCLTTQPVLANGNSEWKELIQDGNVVGAINDNGVNLGTVTVDFHLNDVFLNGIRLDQKSKPMLSRYFKINATNHVFTGQQIGLRLYVLDTEIDELVNAAGSGVSSVNDLQIIQYSGQNENCFNADNDTTTSTTITNYLRQQITKTPYQDGYMLEFVVNDHLSEFYMKADQNPNTTLPVELLSFKAVRKGKDALLEWETAVETNNAGYEIEVSADGRKFSKLAWVAGKGSNSRYEFLDRGSDKPGSRYYRLKQLDLDGSFSYSRIRIVDFEGQPAVLQAWPNPFSKSLTVSFVAGREEEVTLKLTDLLGREVYSKAMVVKKGMQQTELELKESLPQGLYLLTLGSKTEKQMIKVVRQ